ncbi:MAG: RnfABCDGE type electron transport complex subunit D [Clostridiales bacterium]|jgi:electron transport complex protein RnfD|nr:RnfABCDGE type electron transport complex subunit D [Clostridiales bacterium]
MSDERILTASASPHIKSPATTSRIMLDVIIALIPALAAGVIIFGPRVLAVTAVTIAASVVSEHLSRKVMKRHNTLGDFSAVVTGLILAFNLPSTIPLWMAAFGSVIAIVVAKQMFGGIGQNFVNPAILARIVLMVSFPAAMLSSWENAFAWRGGGIDAVSSATPLAALGGTGGAPSLFQMFFARSGCIGEACAFALILGGLYLMAKRVILPVIPVCFIGTVAVFMFIYGAVSQKDALSFTLYHLLGGGLLFGAFFMATDYTTSPLSIKGKIIFAVGCGLITSVIRVFGNMTEGVSFSIILMNILVPHIDNMTAPTPFGVVKEKRRKRKKQSAEDACEKEVAST